MFLYLIRKPMNRIIFFFANYESNLRWVKRTSFLSFHIVIRTKKSNVIYSFIKFIFVYAETVVRFVLCCLCSFATESRDHLLLTCDFSSQLWKMVFSRICPRQRLFCSWTELLSWIRASTPSAPALLRRITGQALIYSIWRQRNNILHNSQRIAPPVIFKLVDREIRNIISSRRLRKKWRNLMLLWIR